MKFIKTFIFVLAAFFLINTISASAAVYTLEYFTGTSKNAVKVNPTIGTISSTVMNPQHTSGQGVKVTAIPTAPYVFTRWEDGNPSPSRTDFITSSTYHVALFTNKPVYLKFSAGAGGSVTGNLSQVVEPGGNGTTVTAVPSAGYIFTGWSDKTTWIRGGRTVDSCDLLDTSRTDTSVTSDITATANFVKLSATIATQFGNTSCTIPNGEKYCVLGANWSINPGITSSHHQLISATADGAFISDGYYENNNTSKPYHYFSTTGFNKDPLLTGGDFGIPLYNGNGAVCIFQGDLGVAPIGLAVTRIDVSADCSSGSKYNTTAQKCEITAPDLSVSNPVHVNASGNPTSAPIIAGEAAYFSSSITNNGSVGTSTTFRHTVLSAGGSSSMPFYSQELQMDLEFDTTSTQNAILGVGRSETTPVTSVTFPLSGINFVQSCVDTRGPEFPAYVGTAPTWPGYSKPTGTDLPNMNLITESNESNNCSSWVQVDVAPALVVNKPDLKADIDALSYVYLNKFVINTDIVFSAPVGNGGNADTNYKGINTFTNKFQTATSIADINNPVGLVDYPVAGMTNLVGSNDITNPWKSTSTYSRFSKSIKFKDTGTYYIRSCADSTGAIDEAHENDNCSSWMTIVLYATGSPDVIASGISPTTGVAGTPQYYTSNIKNIGDMDTNYLGVHSFGVMFQTASGFDLTNGIRDYDKPNDLVNYNPTISSGLAVLKSAGTSHTDNGNTYFDDQHDASMEIQFPEARNYYYIRACADKSSVSDITGVIVESLEGNNCGAWTEITVSAALSTSGTLTVLPSTCEIKKNQSSCTVTGAKWTTTNATSPALIDVNMGTTLSSLANQNTAMEVWVGYPQTIFRLMDGTNTLDTKTVTVSCESGTEWSIINNKCIKSVVVDKDGVWGAWSACGSCDINNNGTQSRSCLGQSGNGADCSLLDSYGSSRSCICPPPGGGFISSFTPSVPQIYKGKSVTLNWDSTADSCTMVDSKGIVIDIGSKKKGSVDVKPTSNTGYTLTCKKGAVTETKGANVKVLTIVITEI